ncbi:hypothetical protein [Desulfurococcus sp.]|uniref:hypothetical protein n=1 Tax=Desulfurococcus sp. TaxID=51678 RepID=UPI00317A2588
MKLSQKWRDAMWSEAAMKVLGVLHDLGTVKSIRELSRVTGLHEFYIRELIAGAKRHRSKLKHLVRYTKIKHGVKTSCDITVHGRMFFHLLRVTDIPTDDELSLLARCAELSAKRKGRTEIVPDAIGIFKEVWDEMMNCECCRATLADDKVIKITREGLEAVIKGMNLDKSAANRHRTDIALTSHRHRTDIALTSLPCTLVTPLFTSSAFSLLST